MPVRSLFNECKAAQAAAFLLAKGGGRLDLLKVMKLMYLAERTSLQRYGDPITGDEIYALQHGPALSQTLDLMNGSTRSTAGYWDHWIEDVAHRQVALNDGVMTGEPEDVLLELSETDIECLQEVWSHFGAWPTFALVEFTHSKACAEWRDPQGFARPIPVSRILKAAGKNAPEIEAITARIRAQRFIASALS